jgi:hypothetical protein
MVERMKKAGSTKKWVPKATELRSSDSRGGCPYAILVAAGVVLRGYQDQAWA